MFIVFLKFLSVNFRKGLTHLICDKDDFTLSAWYGKESEKGYKLSTAGLHLLAHALACRHRGKAATSALA